MKFKISLCIINFYLFINQFCICNETKVEQAFISNELVPDVLDVAPSKELEIFYPESKKKVELGNELPPADVRQIPEVHYEANSDDYYTLLMIDPDGPSRANPIKRSSQHWLVVNIPGSEVTKGEILSEYIGAGPPLDSGFHRYTLLVYKQPNKIKFDEPYRSNSEASTRGSFSIRNFAEKYNLGSPIAGNFFESQYDDTVPLLQKQFTS